MTSPWPAPRRFTPISPACVGGHPDGEAGQNGAHQPALYHQPGGARAEECRDGARVDAVFATYPKVLAGRPLVLRRLIFEVAAETAGLGEIEETLKWGQPSYLTTQSGSGSTIRIDQIRVRPGK
jgi:hypothetical protein